MSLEKQLVEAQQALNDLLTDEELMTNLEAEQVLEIDGLKDSGSKDFAALASLEGKRAALSAMLDEQRSVVAQARANLAQLEAKMQREALLSEVGQVARNIGGQRAELDAALQALFQAGGHHIITIVQAYDEWLKLRARWFDLARQLGINARNMDELERLTPELQWRNIPVDMLRLVRMTGRPAETDRLDEWPMPAFAGREDDMETRVRIFLQQAAIESIRAAGEIEARQIARMERSPRGNWDGNRNDELFAHLPRQQQASSYSDPLQHEGQHGGKK